MGPPGVWTNAVAIDPSAPGTIYAGTDVGVARSTDSGESWVDLPNGPTRVTRIAIDAAAPSTLYAVSSSGSQYANSPTDGIYRSMDSGETWSRIYAPGNGQWVSKVISLGTASSAVLAGTLSRACVYDFCFARTGSAIRSSNRGQTWFDVGLDQPVTSFALDPLIPTSIYATTGTSASLFTSASAGGVWRSTNGGAIWAFAANGLPRWTSAGDAIGYLSLAVDPTDPLTLYAGSSTEGVFKSIDAAGSWASASAGITNGPITSIAVDPSEPSVVYAGASSGVFRSTNGGENWDLLPLSPHNVTSLTPDPLDHRMWFAVGSGRLSGITFGPSPCVPGPQALCLKGGRFKVEVAWETQDRSGVGQAVAVSGDTGYFWFFRPSNVELAVKIIDGTPVNGNFWVFAGGLSGVEYRITVTDSRTGDVKRYPHSRGQPASFADTSAFPEGDGADSQPLANSFALPITETAYLGQVDACAAAPATLCLNGARFKVDVAWRTKDGRSGIGQAVPLTSDAGYFWFFNGANVELVLKVLDGRPVNGRHWVFYGALSNVAYTITVTDTETGIVKTYENPQGTLASVADVEAF